MLGEIVVQMYSMYFGMRNKPLSGCLCCCSTFNDRWLY